MKEVMAMDTRTPLRQGSLLCLSDRNGAGGREYTYRLGECIGAGATCLVYRATCQDSQRQWHTVLIKEFYPYVLSVHRKEQRLQVAPADERAFQKGLARFCKGYMIGVTIRQQKGLVNSTTDSQQLLYGNGTVYMAVRIMEGLSYDALPQEPPQAALIRLRAIAVVINRYHELGYVHLDLKPANIFILPETKEHILILDFDTVYPLAALHSGELPSLCYSADYAAPEQRLGYASKISPAADIYSLGAILYKKLTGRTIAEFAYAPGKAYDFTTLREHHKDLPPSFWRRLTIFLKRALAPAAQRRYQKIVGPFLEELDALIALAQPDQHILQAHFTYHNEHFIGRVAELAAIEDGLSQSNTLFLHGMGGIGKSDLARQYAWTRRKAYDTIVFIPYEGSLEETIASDSTLTISHMRSEPDETQSAYYERKLDTLRSSCTDRTLLILDNLDTEDERLEDFLSCPAKILITSRLDMSDWNYPQLDIEAFPTLKEQLELFHSYNRQSYSGTDQQALLGLLHYICGHTMTIELLAKYLRDSASPPQELLKKFHSQPGLAASNSKVVRHRKDFRLNRGSVLEHLHILFSLTGLTENECALLRNLALPGSIHIDTKLFCRWCALPEDTAARLCRLGWLKEDDGGKLFLHQVILDLIYKDLPPRPEASLALIRSLQHCLCRGFTDYSERSHYGRLCRRVIERLPGETAPLIRLYWLYCQHLHKEEPLLQHCIRWYGQHVPCPYFALASCLSLLAQYYQKNAWDWDKTNGARKAIPLYEQAFEACCQPGPANTLPKARALLRLGQSSLDNMPILLEIDHEEEVLQFGTLAEKAWRRADELLKTVQPLSAPARQLWLDTLQQLQDLYDPYNLTSLVLSEHFGNAKKKLALTQKIDALNETGIPSTPLADAGMDEASQGNYEKALSYLEEALKAGEGEDFILPLLSEYYEKVGNLTQALHYADRLLVLDQGRSSLVPISGDYHELARLHHALGHEEEGHFFLMKCLEAARRECKDNKDPFRLFQMGQALLLACRLEPEMAPFQQEFMAFCHSHYEELLSEYLAYPVLIGYANSLRKGHHWHDCLTVFLDLGRRRAAILPAAKEDFDRLFSALEVSVPIAEAHEPEQRAALLTMLGQLCQGQSVGIDDEQGLLKKARIYYEDAFEETCRLQGPDSLAAHGLRDCLAQLYCSLSDSAAYRRYGGECNYFLLAQARLEEEKPLNPCPIWQEAADNYALYDRPGEACRCCDALLSSWQPVVTEEAECQAYISLLLCGARQARLIQEWDRQQGYIERCLVLLPRLALSAGWLQQQYESCAQASLEAGKDDWAQASFLTALFLLAWEDKDLLPQAVLADWLCQPPDCQQEQVLTLLKTKPAEFHRDALIKGLTDLDKLATRTKQEQLSQWCRTLKSYYEEQEFSFPDL